MKYIIQIRKGETVGYFDENQEFTLAQKDDATIFNTMKEARRQLNRLNGRLMKDCVSSIELLKEKS